MRKIVTLIAVIMIILTSCKMYDWHYQYSGYEEREVTPALMDSLKQNKMNYE